MTRFHLAGLYGGKSYEKGSPLKSISLLLKAW